MPRTTEPLEISDLQHRELERLIAAPTTPQRVVSRARIVLARAAGRTQLAAAAELGVSRPAVIRWERRFAALGVDGLLKDAPGRGRKTSIPEGKKDKLITQAAQPPPNRTRWSVRSMARQVGVSPASVQRIWAANAIKPHLTRTFKLSRDPQFESKFWDVIGLYLNPPDRALVLCCDEKSQCQALERSQPGLPLGIGHVRTRPHDCIRHGTVTLFAALNYLDGKILSTTARQHTHVEWPAFRSTHRTVLGPAADHKPAEHHVGLQPRARLSVQAYRIQCLKDLALEQGLRRHRRRTGPRRSRRNAYSSPPASHRTSA